MTAALAGLQALALIDRPLAVPATVNGTLEVVLPDWQWRRRTWPPHPACSCGAACDYRHGSAPTPLRRNDAVTDAS
jgi:hypothetical protein